MRSAVALVILSAALAACGARPVDDASLELAALDSELAAAQAVNAVDPQVMAALGDPIMTDPLLATGSNADALRPSSRPYGAPVPPIDIARGTLVGDSSLSPAPAPSPLTPSMASPYPTLSVLVRGNLPGRRSACAARLSDSAGWAAQFPTAIPLHPDARVIAAAGSDEAGCTLRAARFFAAHTPARVLAFYHARARQAGLPSEHHAVGGRHRLRGMKDDFAYVVFVTDRNDGGSDVELMTTG